MLKKLGIATGVTFAGGGIAALLLYKCFSAKNKLQNESHSENKEKKEQKLQTHVQQLIDDGAIHDAAAHIVQKTLGDDAITKKTIDRLVTFFKDYQIPPNEQERFAGIKVGAQGCYGMHEHLYDEVYKAQNKADRYLQLLYVLVFQQEPDSNRYTSVQLFNAVADYMLNHGALNPQDQKYWGDAIEIIKEKSAEEHDAV